MVRSELLSEEAEVVVLTVSQANEAVCWGVYGGRSRVMGDGAGVPVFRTLFLDISPMSFAAVSSFVHLIDPILTVYCGPPSTEEHQVGDT